MISPNRQLMRRVLIVEDDEPLADVIAEVLTFENCDADFAPNALEALQRLDAGDYDAILCDVLMPRMSGEEFFRLVCQRHPHLRDRMLFMTGTTTIRSGLTDFLVGTGLPLLEKPFTVEQLRAALRELWSR
ncbi:MAG: response regulator [Verrucomicrobiae bacterium]|nr:response regulator [Verrucomicrobiae bacterium]MDW8343582.1 response regulator [Verrucomicrobiae bacterium]